MNKHLKILAIMLCVCFAGLSVYSQDETARPGSFLQELNYGVKLGATFSGLADNYQTFTNRRQGLFAGAFLEYELRNFLSISTEIRYIQMGALNTDPQFLYNAQDIFTPAYTIVETKQLTSHNIQIPLFLNVYFRDFDCCVAPFLSVGYSAYYTASVNAENLVSYGAMGQKQIFATQNHDVTSKFREWNSQLIIGPSVMFNYDWGSLTGGLHYQIGLNNINEFQYDDQLYDFTGNTLVFFLGYRFK
jgi:hypothetical protein